MQYKRLALIFGVTSIFILTGCLKDHNDFIAYDENIETSAFGVVLGDINLPVENATVAYEGEKTTTDSNGIFIFSDVVIPRTGGRLTVDHPDYFPTVQSVIPTEDNRSINLHLQPLGQTYNISARIGGSVSSVDNVTLQIPPDAFELGNGQLYSGTVVSNVGYVDPLHIDAYDQIPGGHFGVDKNDNSKLLEHYGTIYTQFEGAGGEDLQISDNVTYLLVFPLDDETLAHAPQEITLWKLEDADGQWKEYGLAQLEGKSYRAEVDRIGIWSIQIPFSYARISGQVKDQSGQPLERARIALSRKDHPVKVRQWTDNEGLFSVQFPIDHALDISVEDECGNELYTTSEGPFLGNYELADIEIDPGSNYWRLSGVITECNTLSKGIEKGYSLIQTSLYRWITPVERNGNFTTGLFNCGSKFTVIGRDLLNSRGTNLVDFSELPDEDRRYSLGIMEACR
ncbi:MAG: carboxypeptidase-like regulatory domain-containing protein [Saprospiraceae bacterium]|nr:carboxypeptidase-like regulatory domain-containing protein [Saprospiraceae bacterium]